MTITIAIDAQIIHNLDLSPVQKVIAGLPQGEGLTAFFGQLSFTIDYPREATDPRELSEIPEIRLWFLRLDAHYPWLPLLLDGQSGELYRYTAMMVPHQFSRAEGIQYNPEALEIFVMQKTFVITSWLRRQEISAQSRLKMFSQALGYDIDDDFFELVKQ